MTWTPKQLVSLEMEDELQQARTITNNLAAGDLAVLGLSNLIGNTVLGKLLLVTSHH